MSADSKDEATMADEKKTPSTKPRRLQRREALMATRDLAACLDAIEAELRTNSKIDCYAINLHQPEENALVCARLHMPSAYSNIEDTFSQFSMPLEEKDASTIAIKTGTAINITEKNLKEFSLRTQAGFVYGKMRNLVVLPIPPADPDQPTTGTLVLISQHNPLPASLIVSVSKLLEDAAQILQFHQRMANLEARNYAIQIAEKELQSQLQFISAMNHLTTEEEIYPRLEQEFMDRYDLDFAAVLIADSGVLRCADTQLISEDTSLGENWKKHCAQIAYLLEHTDSATSNAFINNQPLYFGNIPKLQNLPMSQHDRENLDILKDLQTFAINPIRKRGLPIGVLWLGSMRRQRALSKEQLAHIQQLCDFLGGVIDTARHPLH